MSLFSSQRINQSLTFLLLAILGACSWNVAPAQQLQPVSKAISSSIGPYAAFSGRLIVITPSKRWQVEIDWQSYKPETGKLRLNHAFSSTVVDFRWNSTQMEVRDNQFPYWRNINPEELAELGIVIPPSQLSSILLGNIPAHFHQKKSNMWESKQTGSLIRLLWQAQRQQLTISDIQHGRIAKLIIQ